MATATAYKQTNMDTADFSYDQFSITTTTHIQVLKSSNSNVMDIYGSFSYNASNQLTGGTITSLIASNNVGQKYAISGGSYNAVTFFTYILYSNYSGLIEYLFAGNDVLNGSAYADVLNGNAGNDTIYGNGGNDTLRGGAGNDTLNGGSGADNMIGGNGSDLYYVDNVGDIVTETNAIASTGGTDTVNSSFSAYTLPTNVENGRILSTGSADLTGNELNNLIYAGAGINQIDGAAGTDTVSYLYAATAGTAGVTLNLGIVNASDQSTASGISGADLIKNIENITGSNYADNLTGNSESNVLNGGGGNDTLNGGSGADIMNGGNGSDLYYVDNVGDIVTETNAIASTGGTDMVYSSLSDYTLTTNVENGRILSIDSANLTGNGLNNLIYAGAGINQIDGGAGTDTVSYAYATTAGTAGVTLNLSIVNASGQSTASGISGADLVKNIENITGSNYVDYLTGNSGSNVLNGGIGDDILNGGAGNDTLNGSIGNDVLNGGSGADTMNGGDGSDLYYVDNVGDIVTETNAIASTGGIDTVFSYLSAYTLTANVEIGRILSTGSANMTGNGLNNLIYAGAGINQIDGGAGTDTVSYAYATTAGAAGVTLNLGIVNASGQSTAGGISGADLIKNIENITGSNYADNLTGNSGRNVLNGGAGNDTLNGGTGADLMIGGDGSDLYYVDNVGDIVTETNAIASTGGTDTVYSSLSAYTLTANVENGRILSTGSANLTGNDLNNLIYAGAGINQIDGGSGTDTVSYAYATTTGTAGVTLNLAIVNPSGQSTASGISGADLVKNIENITGSIYADYLTGNSGDNVLNGGAGNDTLNGDDGNDTLNGGAGNDLIIGGLGNDFLSGGAGLDIFVFNTALNSSTNMDTITDFSVVDDQIQLANIIFNQLITGGLNADNFRASTDGTAADADDYVLYNTTTGVLSYDTDGNGAGAAVEIATVGVSTHPTLTSADFIVI
jgi:Ca2+-binding RTX toxin-like protein